MPRILAAISVAAVVLLVAGVVAAGAGGQLEDPEQFTVVERPVTLNVETDIGEPGDSTGDLLTFANKLYDETNNDVVGKDQGNCIRINPRKGSFECAWTNFLEGGTIAVEGPFFDTRDSVVAVTGGTGVFRNAGGQMRLHHRNDGNFDFFFKLIP